MPIAEQTPLYVPDLIRPDGAQRPLDRARDPHDTPDEAAFRAWQVHIDAGRIATSAPPAGAGALRLAGLATLLGRSRQEVRA